MVRFKSRKRFIRKRSFLLLELLISLALVTLCLFPLIQPHSIFRRQSWKYLEQIQLEVQAQRAYCLVKEKLFKEEHNWTQFKKGISGELTQVFEIAMGKEKKKSFSCKYAIQEIDRQKKEGKIGIVVGIDLSFLSGNSESEEAHFQRTLYLEAQKG